MIGNELSHFFFVGSEFLFLSALIGTGSDVVWVFVLLAKIVDAGEADGIFFCDIFTFHTVVAIVQDADSQINRISMGHNVHRENKNQNQSPSLTIFQKLLQNKCKYALDTYHSYFMLPRNTARSQIVDVEFARQQLLLQSSVAVQQQSEQIKQLMLSLLQG